MLRARPRLTMALAMPASLVLASGTRMPTEYASLSIKGPKAGAVLLALHCLQNSTLDRTADHRPIEVFPIHELLAQARVDLL